MTRNPGSLKISFANPINAVLLGRAFLCSGDGEGIIDDPWNVMHAEQQIIRVIHSVHKLEEGVAEPFENGVKMH